MEHSEYFGEVQMPGVKTKSRESDATSDETLSDVEEKEKVSDVSDSSQSKVPAPDAEPGHREKNDDAGPM